MQWRSVFIKTPNGNTNVLIRYNDLIRQDNKYCPSYNQLQHIHPITSLVFILLQIIPFLMFYFAVNMLTKQYAIAINIVSFYFNKNIAGRKMVGMKWGFILDRYKNPCWRLQFAPHKNNPMLQVVIFWIIQVIVSFAWIASVMTSLYSPLQLSIAGTMGLLQVFNFYGFLRCSMKFNLINELQPHFQQLQDPEYSIIILQN